jgi:subtilase family serine protease
MPGARDTAAVTSLPAGYGPDQFHGGYALGTEAPQPQTIAIVDAFNDPTIRADLTTYDTTYGIAELPTCTATVTAACFLQVNQRGEASPLPAAEPGWDLEISLDVETAHELCQNCKIDLVEARTSSLLNLDTAEQEAVKLGATEISNSWGTKREPLREPLDNADFNHPNIAVVAATGDEGYRRFGFPASSPDVIAAGGTTLNLTNIGGGYSWASEESWSGSGSGCSRYFTAQSWQPLASGWPSTLCGAKRAVADVSADANPETGAAVYDSTGYEGEFGWFQVGGTSLSSPIIASVYALAGNAASVEYPASLPYATVAGLHDITAGPATGKCLLACRPRKGYDTPTGLGSPMGTAAF